ncbi:type I secretion system permease/ATPase [Shewanella sp. Isolate11]|uniref:type I secretion system permease/ATPase n=1 Tax=Shewanella sp. Isolate11 TaxID=2908530 RepID=UPI001EFC3B1A|nr:type I secretion system permease/ATPase [Shewanella sp. Isolate11]MCG9698426.1 type I secretion system permease/ATPase [Shewanella sp. Isolate11]
MINPTQDALVNVIEALCLQLGLTFSKPTLLKHIVVSDGRLSTMDLVQACNNVGIEAVEQKLPLNKLALPAIVISKQHQPGLLSKDPLGRLQLLDAEGQQAEISEAEFKANFYQDSWHVKRHMVTDARSEEHHFSVKRHWLLAAFDEVKPFYGSFLLGSLAINILALVTPLFTMNVYDRVVPNQAIDTLWVLATGASLAIIFDWLLKQARTRLADVAGKQVDIRMSNILFAKVLGMRLENRPASAGAFAKQLQEFDSIRDFITSATLVTAVDLPFTLLFLALISWLGGYMVLVPIVCMLLLFIISFVMQKKLMATIEHTSQLSTQRQAHLIETLNLLVETKQNNGEAKAQRIWDDTVSSLADWQNESRIASNTLSHSVMNSQQLVTIGLIITGVYQIHAGNLSMGGLIAIVMLSGRAANAINQISMLLLKFKQTQSAITAVNSILELPQEQQKAHQSSNSVGFNGAVSLRNASFNYPDHSLPAFTEVNLNIEPGEKIGLLGPAGAGKSSLLAIMAGQYQLSSGQLFYNRLEARQWSIGDIRANVGWMSQQPALIYGTVLDNLLFGLTRVDETLLANIIVSSGIDKLMDRLGSGLDSQVGEFGRQLSGGQRQAIALGRVLLRQPKLMLLDEPTSAMDERSENQIIACLSQITDTSMVIASHNPKLLALCDRILVIDKGRIIHEQIPDEMRQRGKSRIKAVNVRQKGEAK